MIEHPVKSYRLKDFVIEAKSKIAVFIGLGVLLSVLILGFYFTLNKNNQPKIYRGKVVDKWLSIKETEQGSTISRGFLIETESGSKFKMIPTSEEYELLKIDNLIENEGDEIKKLHSDNIKK